MRGNPIKEWIIFSAIWLLLLIPVIKLTAFRQRTEIITQSQHETETSLVLVNTITILRYTGKPLFIKITQNGQILCNLNNPQPEETELDLPILIEEKSTELLVQAEWPDENRHVLEIKLIVTGEEEQKTHCWSEKELDEAVSFSW